MGIKFYNTRTGETRLCTTEPMISAYWASSDRGPNVSQGQDFGWRLHPETKIEVEKIQQNPETLQRIAVTYNLPLGEVSESNILKYIADQGDSSKSGEGHSNKDFEAHYEAEIRKLREANAKISNEPEFVPGDGESKSDSKAKSNKKESKNG